VSATIPVAVQLYSLREPAAVDFEAVLRSVAEMGYVGVELAGFNGLAPARVGEILSDTGMVVSSAHTAELDSDKLHQVLDDVQAVGCDKLVIAVIRPDGFTDMDAVRRSAEALNQAHEIASARGVALGYHNQWWEFERSIDGRTAWSHLFELVHPDVFAELDLYWAIVGQTNPVDALSELGARVRLLHVKDGPGDVPQSSMVAVGTGSVDIPGVLATGPMVEWHIVELDRCDTDMTTAVSESYSYLVQAGLSRGRK
jgi:sugar phosphate isomerase/epimerase